MASIAVAVLTAGEKRRVFFTKTRSVRGTFGGGLLLFGGEGREVTHQVGHFGPFADPMKWVTSRGGRPWGTKIIMGPSGPREPWGHAVSRELP